MKNLSLEQIEKLIWAKKDAQERLSFMKNRSAARELWNDLQSEINTLQAIAKSKMHRLEITITNGAESQTRNLRKGTTIERGVEILQNLFDADYLGCSYTLWVDDAEYLTLEY